MLILMPTPLFFLFFYIMHLVGFLDGGVMLILRVAVTIILGGLLSVIQNFMVIFEVYF